MTKLKMTQQELDTSLFEAIAVNSVNDARLAIASGANVNAMNEHGQSPLHFAAREDFSEPRLSIARLMIEKGADLNARNSRGETPERAAYNQGNDQMVATLGNAERQQLRYASRVTEERKDKGPPQVGG